eukprot:gb/GECH01006622.1/.p1 GENE.gb/GECH01006622.1/~~gb/GECH01006622.1/.p1  ORF type:complete len:306 (+),score=101.05 gb/GECH01006622.1/:1-918(+)
MTTLSPRSKPKASSFDSWFEKDTIYREISYQLEIGIELVKDIYVFQRKEGMEMLAETLSSIQTSQEIAIFRIIQSEQKPITNVLSCVWSNILYRAPLELGIQKQQKPNKKKRRQEKKMEPVTTEEILLALNLMEGVYILLGSSCPIDLTALKFYMGILSEECEFDLKIAALDTLLAYVSSTPHNLLIFWEHSGFKTLIAMLMNKSYNRELRRKTAEFLSLLSHVVGRHKSPEFLLHRIDSESKSLSSLKSNSEYYKDRLKVSMKTSLVKELIGLVVTSSNHEPKTSNTDDITKKLDEFLDHLDGV